MNVQPELEIETYKYVDNKLNGIRAMVNLDEEHLLFNNDFEQLRLLNIRTGTIDIVHPAGMPNIWPLSKIIKRDELIYAAARGGKLLALDVSKREYEEWDIGFEFTKFSFVEKSKIAISSILGDIYLFDLSTEELTPLLSSKANKKINAKVTEVLTDGEVLLITALNGLWQLGLESQELKHFKDNHPILGESMLTIAVQDSGELWLGTSNQGIIRFNRYSNSLKQISSANGLSKIL